MASSNRHWPSLFKSKPCNAHHQWQHDINHASLLSNPCQKPPFASPGGGGAEERTPEPKPRWNPKPEQIRILEAIFNSGMVNPPRDEIRRIRVQLQEYGQVGDANVFYWFQNRKSRSKHKQRQLQSRQHQQQQQTRPTSNVISVTTASSSSSSSDPSNSSGCSDKTLTSLSSKTTSITGTAGGGMMELSNNSPTASVNQSYFTPGELPLDQFFFHAHAHAQAQAQAQAHAQAQGYNCNISPADLSLSSLVAAEQQGNLGLRSGFWSELMMTQPQPAESGCKNISAVLDGDYHLVMDETKGKMHHHHQQQFHSNNIYGSPAPIATAPIITAASILQPPPSPTPQAPQPQPQPPPPPPAVTATTTTTTGATKDASLLLSAPISEMLQGIGVPTMVVFINDEAYEVGVGPLNVKLAFGLDAVLFHSSGLPVLVDDWGVTLHPLQNGASYYV